MRALHASEIEPSTSISSMRSTKIVRDQPTFGEVLYRESQAAWHGWYCRYRLHMIVLVLQIGAAQGGKASPKYSVSDRWPQPERSAHLLGLGECP